MTTQHPYSESGSSPPSKSSGYLLGFTPWAHPLMVVTDDYEEICLGFKRGKNGIKYVGVSGRLVPAEGTALYQLGAQS